MRDVFYTLLSVIGLADKSLHPGQDLTSTELNTAATDIYYAEAEKPYADYNWAPLRTVIKGKWKYIRAPSPELYNLENDWEENRRGAPQGA